MENPKLRIETDGKTTEIYIDGQQVLGACMLDIHAEPFEVYCKLEKYKRDAEGQYIVEKDELLRESIILIDTTSK